jgi:hypothetical protein
MKTENLEIPSIVKILEERNSLFLKENSAVVQKQLFDPIWEILQRLHEKGKVLFIEHKPITKNKTETFIILYKIFYAETKYFKMFFHFSGNRFLGISLNATTEIIESCFFKNHLENWLIGEVKKGYFGIAIENHYMKFLPIFKANNSCCRGFRNLTSDLEYDKHGIDVEITFVHGIITMQLKGVTKFYNLEKQKKIAERHFNQYPETPLMFVSLEEKYPESKKRLIELRNRVWEGKYPFVSFVEF